MAAWTSFAFRSGKSSSPLNLALAFFVAIAVFTVDPMPLRVWKPLKADCILTVAAWTSLAFRSGKSSSPLNFDFAALAANALLTVEPISLRVWKPLKADCIFIVASCTSFALRSGRSSMGVGFLPFFCAAVAFILADFDGTLSLTSFRA